MPKKHILTTLLFFVLAHGKVTYAGSTPPTTTYSLDPASPNGENGWYITPVQVTLTATDLESGVKETNYRINYGTWQKNTFTDTLNLVPNPSFEIADSTTSGLQNWEATVIENATYSQDTTEYAPGFETSSAKIISNGGAWHGINHKDSFAAASPYENMTASVWLKSPSPTGQSRFRIYGIKADETTQLIESSNQVIGQENWTNVTLDFVVNMEDAIGVYMDVGIIGAGTVWIDAASITSSPLPAITSFAVGSDSEEHIVEFYSIDFAGNVETTNSISFKIDQTPPGNWHDSGASRWFWDPPYKLYVYVTVEDPTSGLHWATDGYKYHTELNEGFGRFSDLRNCSSTWQPFDEDEWIWAFTWKIFSNGAKSTSLWTPKTSFCNDNWRLCKAVRFRAEDLAGNVGTKEFCINGPWIKVAGEAIVRSNNNINMLAEADGDNTDGLIEAVGSTIEFFTSSRNWELTNSSTPPDYTYNDFWEATPNKTEISNLTTNSGVYSITDSFEIDAGSVPGGFDSTEFNQIIFVNGNLKISTDVEIANAATALFVVSGDVEIAKEVTTVGLAIFADGEFYTAYNIEEGDATETLELYGLFSADKFVFQRTLQGTDNNDASSEDFNYEPKYAISLKEYLGGNTVTWLGVE
jgi:hypothetical protein